MRQACRALQVPQALPADLRGQLVRLDQLVQWGPRENKARPVPRGPQVPRVLPDRRALLVLLVRPAPQVRLA